MPAFSDLVPRRAQSIVSEALEDTRVVLINGARQAGKSTLTRIAADGRPGTVVRLLDDAATLRAAPTTPRARKVVPCRRNSLKERRPQLLT